MATAPAPPVTASRPSGLAGLTPSGRAIVPVSWALYDLANTIFSYAVVSTAIGLWLTDAARFGQGTGEAVQGLVVAISVGLNALVSPILGALSDRGGRRLPFLFVFTVLTIVPTAFIGASPAVLGAVLYGVANFAYQAALIYYDATLTTVSYPHTRGRLSGIGVGVGYIGTILIGLTLALLDDGLGIIDLEGYFLIAALGYAVFAIPIFLVVRERATGAVVDRATVVASFGQLRETIRAARQVPGLGRFLLGRFFYSDAVNAIIVVMSVIAVRVMGFTTGQFLLISILLTVVAIGASIVWGRLVDRFGPRRTLLWVLASWAIGLVLGAAALSLSGTTPGNVLFIVAGAIVGSGLGGVQVADRVLMTRLSPPQRLGEFFGLYGLVGKGSQVIGLLVYTSTVAVLFPILANGAYQVAVLTLLVTMLIGYALLRGVDDRWQEDGGDEDALGPRVAASPPPDRLIPGHGPLQDRG